MRQILHVDLDAFFASVEELDNPKLKGYPIAVSGLSDHGIVTTANYKARKYGIHSAMPVFMAKKACPNLILLPIRKQRYVQMSHFVFTILKEYSPLVEKVSIDEAYLDLSHVKDFKATALEIKNRIYHETGLTISCGLSYNKFLAKLASDMNKPNGLTIIEESQVVDLLSKLPIRKIHGIGEKSEKKLKSIGIETGKDLMGLEKKFLEYLLGKAGIEIFHRIRGKDERPVDPNRVRKSIGTEETFTRHTKNKVDLHKKLKEYSKELAIAMEKKGFAAYTLTLKIKTIQFESHTRSKTLERPFRSQKEIYETALLLLDEVEIEEKLRLMGLTLSSLITEEVEQLFFL